MKKITHDVRIGGRLVTRDELMVALKLIDTPKLPEYGQKFIRYEGGDIFIRVKPHDGEARFVERWFDFKGMSSKYPVVAINLSTGTVDGFQGDSTFYAVSDFEGANQAQCNKAIGGGGLNPVARPGAPTPAARANGLDASSY